MCALPSVAEGGCVCVDIPGGRATHTLRRRIGSKPVPADRDERQKLSAYLARRGFNYSAIRAAWQRVDSSDDLDWLETPESDE